MNYIVDQIGLIVAAMRSEEDGEPYYMYGHRQEIADRLKIKGKDPVFKNEKYPLIALRLDIQEVINNGLVEYDLNLVIVSLSDKIRNAEQRYTDVIKPDLTPLYERFFIELKNIGFFTWDGDLNKPPHTKIDRPYWGIPDNEGNIRNIFNDPLDAIEIQGLKIRGRQYDCEVPTLPDNRVTINVNSSLFAKVKPFLTYNVPVIDENGLLVGSKIGNNWVVPSAGVCPTLTELWEASTTEQKTELYIALPNETLVELYLALNDAQRLVMYQGLSDEQRLALFVGLPTQDQNDLYDGLSNAVRLQLFNYISNAKKEQLVFYTYPYPSLYTGQVTSYQTGDDKHQWDNIYTPEINSWPTDRPWSFATLDPTNFNKLLRGATASGFNIFGNLDRVTDDLGGQTYANGVYIDHLLGEMGDLTFKAASNWSNAISSSVASTFYGKNDWRIKNYNGWTLSTKRAQDSNYLSGLPPITFLSVPADSGDRFLWASTSGDGSANTLSNTYFLRQSVITSARNQMANTAKSSTVPQSLYSRKCFTYNPSTGLMELS